MGIDHGSVVPFDFKSARERQAGWRSHYRLLKQMGKLTPELEFEIMAFIDEIEREIAEAHATAAGRMRMTAVTGSGHPIVHIGNVLNPIIPAWAAGINQLEDKNL